MGLSSNFSTIISLHHSHGEDYCFWYYYYYSLSPKIFPEVHDFFFIDSPWGPHYDDRVVLTLTYFSRSQVCSKSKFSNFQITISQKLSVVQHNGFTKLIMHVFALYATKIIEVTHAEHTKLINFMNGGSATFRHKPKHSGMQLALQIVHNRHGQVGKGRF